jgi:hypothetical protein
MVQPTSMDLLQRKISKAEEELIKKRNPSSPYDDDMAVLFTGNHHDAIPRSMIINEDLSPSERITWMVLRTGTSDPTKPGAIAKRSDLARAIGVSAPSVTTHRAMLRIQRWLTHCKHVRNHGKFIGDIYLLHDDPLSLASTLEVDPTYIQFLELQQQSENKRIRAAASRELMTISSLMASSTTELDVMEKRINQYKQHSDQSKNFAPVDLDDLLDEVNHNQADLPFDEDLQANENNQSKNLAPDKTDQSKNFALVNKKISFISSSNSGSSSTEILTGRAREKLSVERLSKISSYRDIRSNAAGVYGSNYTMGDIENMIIRYFPAFAHPYLMTRYLLGNTSALALSIIYRKLKESLTDDEIYVVTAQIFGRFAMAHHGWAEPIRNLQGYTSSLIQAVHQGKFEPDEWAVEVMAMVDQNKPPKFEDSPDLIARRKTMGSWIEPERYSDRFEKWKQGKDWF